MVARTLSARTISSRRWRSHALPPAVTLQAVRASSHPIVALAWSPTGHFLAVAEQHGPIHLFAVHGGNAGAPLRPTAARTLRGHGADVLHLAFSPTNFLASAGMDGVARLWHPQTGACLRALPHPDMVTAVAFHPADAGVLLTAAFDGRARLIRLSDRALVAHADARAALTSAVFLSDRSAALATQSGRLLHWRPHVAEPVAHAWLPDPLTTELVGPMRAKRSRRAAASPPAPLSATAVAARGRRIAVAAATDGRAYELGDGAVTRRLRAHGARKRGVALGAGVSPDGRFVLLDGMFGVVRVLDAAAADGKRREREVAVDVVDIPVLKFGEVSSAAFAGDGVAKRCGRLVPGRDAFILAVGGDDGSVTLVEQEYRSGK